MKLSRIIKTILLTDFIAGLSIAIKEIFKSKKTLNYPFEKGKISQSAPGIKLNGKISTGDNQPPKNNIEPIAHINKIFAYSPNQNIAYIIPEYSV